MTKPSQLAASIDLGGTNLRGALIDSTGQILERVAQAVGEDRSPAGIVDQVLGLLKTLEGHAKKQGKQLIVINNESAGAEYKWLTGQSNHSNYNINVCYST